MHGACGAGGLGAVLASGALLERTACHGAAAVVSRVARHTDVVGLRCASRQVEFLVGGTLSGRRRAVRLAQPVVVCLAEGTIRARSASVVTRGTAPRRVNLCAGWARSLCAECRATFGLHCHCTECALCARSTIRLALAANKLETSIATQTLRGAVRGARGAMCWRTMGADALPVTALAIGCRRRRLGDVLIKGAALAE